MASQPGRKIPVIEGRRDKQRSFLPTPKTFRSFGPSPDVTSQDNRRPFTQEDTSQPKLKTGDKVCISGVKFGTLRYFGKTHIAPGLWCGITLDDPEGKHDGEVEGVRYFTCIQGHGIFAPVERVTRVEHLSHHNLHDDIIEEETEVPQDSPTEQAPQLPPHLLARPHRRLLPQPKTFTRQGSREKIIIPTKIDEQNEDNDDSGATQKYSDLTNSPSKTKPGSRLTSAKRLSDLDQEQVCTTFAAGNDEERKTLESAYSSSSVALNEKGGGDSIERGVSELTNLQAKPTTNARVLPTLIKPSRLPGSSKLPQLARGDGYRKADLASHTESYQKNTDEPDVARDLNKTYNVHDPKLRIPDSKLIIEGGSSGEESLTGDIQECLESDRRQFLNLTFDTEGGGSPPEHNLQQQGGGDQAGDKSKKFSGSENAPKLDGNKTFNVSSNSSLGILDISDAHLNSDLLQDLSTNSSKESKTSLNLTDSEKLQQVSVLPRRQDRVASLGDTFEVDGAITSTPLITEGKPKSRLPKHSSELITFSDLAQSRKKFAISTESSVVDSEETTDKGECNLNDTYIVEQDKSVAIVGEDTLDWRQEASDGEEHSASSDEGNEVNNETRKLSRKTEIIIQDTDLEEIVENEIGDRVMSLCDHMNKLQIHKDLESSKFKKPMTDSGISEQGDLLLLEQGRMADSCEMKDSGCFSSRMAGSTGPSEFDVCNLSEQELQLHADLLAGHQKKERPLSLVSSISADTGYVPDTDSERGTLTVNSPLDWAEKMATSEMSVSSDTELTELDKAYTESFKHFRSAVMKGTSRIQEESDSDIYSDTGTIVADQDTLKSGSDMENMSSLVMDVKGISADDVLPLEPQTAEEATRNQMPTPTNKGGIPSVSDTVEDERIEADQQLDIDKALLNTTVNITSVTEEFQEVDDTAGEITQVESTETSQVVSDNDDESVDGDKIRTTKGAKVKGKTVTKKKKEVEKIEHKKPNINVGSRLADYIKAPLPTKPKEEKENTEAAKNKRNLGMRKKGKVEEAKMKFEKEEKVEKKKEKPEKEPPKIVKRTPPKSKWDNIMSQIEAGQSTAKPKTEVKSKLEAYLNAAPPPQIKKEAEVKKEKPKKKLPAVPTPDYSRVKSKLNLGAASPLIRRDMSPAPGKRDQSPKTRIMEAAHKRHSSVGSNASLNVALDFNDSVGSSVLESAVSSVRSSHSDLNNIDGSDCGTLTNQKSVNRPTNRTLDKISTSEKRERRESTSSTMSDVSQGSVKVMNNRNSRLSESNAMRRKSMPIKSSIPPPVKSTVKKVSQPSRSLDSSPAKGTNKIINKRGDDSRSAPPPVHRDVAKNKRHESSKNTAPKKSNNQNRNKTKTKNKEKTTQQQQPDVISGPGSHQTKQEITRLEALCESRTKELNFAKIQMKNNIQAFDAMAVLVNYLTHDLNAFSCPSLQLQLATQGQLNGDLQKELGNLQTNKSQLEQEIIEINKKNEETFSQLKTEHSDNMLKKEEEWSKQTKENQQTVEESHRKEVTEIKFSLEKQISEIRSDHSQIILKLKTSQEEEILALQQKQDLQMEELHKQHRDRLEDITHRFEDIKVGLSEKVEALRRECDDLRDRAKASEEALLRDSDVKVQVALAPYRNLPQEIESLKLVIEMRNEEIQKLKKRNGDMKQQAEELMAAKEKIISQQQKIENMEAIISIKTDQEKQLHDKCQMLMRKYDKESKANKRLSMDFEELVWKVNHGDQGSVENLSKLGSSPCNSETSSPLVRRKTRSPALSETEKSPLKVPVYRRSISSNDSVADKKLKRRSATYLTDRERTSPTGSPLHKKHTYSDSSSPTRGLHHHLEVSSHREERMVQSCDDVGTYPTTEDARLVQSCNDADVFETPQGLPNPPTPDDLKHFCAPSDTGKKATTQRVKSDNSAGKTSEVKSTEVSPDDVSVSVETPSGCEFEEFEGEGLTIETQASEGKDDVSDMSHSTESCCHSDVTSGTGSMIWDYEKMDSLRSMDSSQTSQGSDTLQDSNPNIGDTSKVDNNTLTNIKDFTCDE